MGINFGLMVHAMKVNGLMIKQTGLGNCNTQMATYMKDNGVTTRHMAKALTHMLTVPITTGTG